MKRYWIVGLAAIALVALGAAACGDDDDSSKKPAAEATKTDGGASKEATKEATKGATKEATRSSNDGLAALQKAAKDLSKLTYKVSYEISGTDAQTGKIAGTFTLASKPPKSLFGISGDFGQGEGTFLVIDDGTSSFLCTESDGEKSCLKSKSSGAGATELPTIFSVDDLMKSIGDDSTASVKEAQGQKIAGKDGKCFDVKSKEGDGMICFSSDGLVLLIDGQFEGSRITLKAKEASGSPTDKDFEPPYPVIDLGGG